VNVPGAEKFHSWNLMNSSAMRTQAGKSTLNRLELSKLAPTRYHKISHNPMAIKNLLVDLFVEAHERAPRQIEPMAPACASAAWKPVKLKPGPSRRRPARSASCAARASAAIRRTAGSRIHISAAATLLTLFLAWEAIVT
jgi:hypothetical protein